MVPSTPSSVGQVSRHTLACGRLQMLHSQAAITARRLIELWPNYRLLGLIGFAALCVWGRSAVAQSDTQPKPAGAAASPALNAASGNGQSAADRQESIAAERFLELLKKRPRTGTALDKVYGYHVQAGTLDEFNASLRQEAESKNSGEAWMLLGLVGMQRGQDAEARQAFEKAEQLLPKEPLASFYLGRTLILLGEVDAAAAALERAIERKPARADMLQVFQELGRLYQRTRRVDDAVAVWNRMEKLFPGDTQVQEQIAVVLAEEGANAEALVRFEALAKSTKDRFRRVEMAVRAAQLKEALGRRDEALVDFEKILGQVNPDSWIYQDVRSRIDAVFLNRNDYEGLAKYYTTWVEKHPEDIDAMLRIGRLLSVQRRSPEAKEWFTKAIEKAPSQAAPRLALAEALERDQDLSAAAAAMEALVAKSPDNPDFIVRWGELVFADRAIPEPKRAAAAAQIWKKLLDKRGDDPVSVARVADLLRGAELTEDALAAYRKAVELAQDEPQYREYLGEYLFRLDRKEEALAVWRELATGTRETRDNLVRLSEVYSTFKLNDHALETMKKACQLQPTFGQRARYAEMLREAAQYDAALEQLALAGKLAESPEEHALVLDEQIKVYQSSGQLEQRIVELETAVAGSDKDNAAAWEKLALYQEADRKYQQATLSITRAAELEPQSVSIHTAAFRVQERAGLFGDAIKSLHKLAALDRRFLTNYLTQIATLQMRLGQLDEALATGQQLISASGAGSEQFRFFADLCFQAGKTDQGLDALRRNVRSNPGDRDAVRLLARSLAGQFHTEEAIELYWRSYDLSPTLDEKRVDVEALSELYLRSNRFDQLIARLQTGGREENRQREATLLVAAAHQAAGDLGAARALLEPLLREDSRDADLLGTVIKLAQAEFDWEAAVRYQRRLNDVAPASDGEYQLVKFLLEQGEVGEAEAIWSQLSAKSATTENFKQMLDRLMAKGDTERALALVEQAIQREPDNWELLPLAISALWRADKRERAVELADQLLALPVARETRSSAAKQAAAKQAAQPVNAMSAAMLGGAPAASPFTRSAWLSRLNQNTFWLRAMNDPFGGGYGSYSSQSNPIHIFTFADAAAFAAVVKKAAEPAQPQTSEQQAAWLNEQLASDEVEQLWTAVGVLQVASNVSRFPTALSADNAATASGFSDSPRTRLLQRLRELGDTDAVTLLISTRYSERMNQGRRAGDITKLSPLAEADLETIEALYDALPTKIANYSLWLADEFKLADRKDEAQRYFDAAVALIDANPSTNDASSLMRWDKELATRYFVQNLAKNAQLRQASSGSPVNAWYQTATFVGTLLADAQNSQDINRLIAELKQQQAAYAKGLRPSQLAQYDPSKTFNTRMSIGTSGRQLTVQVDFPTQSALQSFDLLVTLRLAHSFAVEAVKEEVGARLEQDANQPDEDVMLSAVDRLCFASWLWWSDSKSAALEQMEKFRELGVAKELATVLQSRMLYEVGRLEDALALLQGFRPLNQQMLQDRELAILQLLLQKGDLTQARQSAERLFALRLPTKTQLQVAEIMTQLGMHEMAESVMQRVRQRGGNDLNTQVQLMQKLVALKNDEAACEFARQIVRRTQVSSNRNIRTINDSYRQQAVRVLVTTGQVKSMIQSLEQRLEKSPKSNTIVYELAEFYEASGKHKEAQAVLGRLAKNDSLDPQALLAAARALAQAGKHAEAVDKYLEAITKQPQLLDQEYYNFRTSIQQAKLWKKVVQKIDEVGIKKFSGSYRTGELVGELVRSNEPEAAKQLIKGILNEHGIPGLIQISSSVLTPGQSSNGKVIDEELQQLAFDQLSSYIDSQSDPAALFQYRSMGGDGRLYGTFAMLNMLLADEPSNIAKLIEKVDPLTAKHAHWRVLLAGLHTISKDYPRAAEAVKPLLDDSDDARRQLEQAVWHLGSLLAHEHGQNQQAVELMEPWLKLNDPGTSGRQELNYTMKGLMLFCYMKTGKLEQAKALLDEEVARFEGDSTVSASNPGYAESQVFQFRATAAEKYVDIGAPLEALLLARSLKTDQKLRQGAQRWNNIEFYDQRIDSAVNRARAKLDKAALEQAVQQLVAGPDRDSLASIRKYPAFLLAPERQESKDRKPQTTCLLMQVLQSRVEDGEDKQWAEKLLSEATATSSSTADGHQPLLGLVALICLADLFDQPETMVALAGALIEVAKASPAEIEPSKMKAGSEGTQSTAKAHALAEARAALAKQERDALWLAVDCLKRRDQKDLAVRLAQAAGTDEDDAAGKSTAQIEARLELARLRLELGETEIAEKQLRTIIDDLFPAKSTPESGTK